MDNRFLSRGKCIDKKKWVEGYLIEQDDPEYHVYICMSGFKAEVDNRHQDILECDLEEIIPETVGRCTGLVDKNGRKIFEGDIIRLYGDELYVIGYSKEYARFVPYDSENYFSNYPINRLAEIVGNIHDNPDILNRADTPVPDDVSQPVLAPATPENFEIFPA